MSVIAWILIGMFAGYISSKFATREGQTIPLMSLGVVGAMAGGFLFQVVSRSGATELTAWTLLIAGTGAALALFSYSAARRIGWLGA